MTSAGNRLRAKLQKDKFKNIESYKVNFSISLEFYHEDLYIDVDKTNIFELKLYLMIKLLVGRFISLGFTADYYMISIFRTLTGKMKY